jgi:hypothetical protein
MNDIKSVLNVEVSRFGSYSDPKPATLKLLTFLKSRKYKNQVDEIRGLNDKSARDEKKALLPAITPSGTFSYRKASGLLNHTGLLQVDIDFKDNEHIKNYDSLKDQLKNISNIAYCGLSVSGQGYWLLIPIAYPEKHREHFLAVEKAFNELGIIIDPSGKDVSRLRGYSYDDEAYINHRAKILTAYSKPEPYKRKIINSLTSNDARAVNYCINQIEKQQLDITEGYEAWFTIGCALANTFKDAGLEYFQRVSQFNSGYSEHETEKKFKECLKGYEYSIGTFFHYCKLVNIIPPMILPKNIGEPAIEINSSIVKFKMITTIKGENYGNLHLQTLWLHDGRKFDILLNTAGEIDPDPENIPLLEDFYERIFQPGTLDGKECLLSSITF